MPTAAKLVASMFFAALGYLLGDMVKPYLEEGVAYPYFSPGLAALGLLIGWRFTGYRIGRGLGGAVGIGLSTGFLFTFWALLLSSFYEMIRLSLRHAYDGPVEAIRGVIEIAVVFGVQVAQPDVVSTLIVGSVIGGYLTRIVATRWS